MSYTLITPPTSEPITEQDLRDHATVDDAVPSTLLAAYISAARASAEFLTGRALAPQVWEATFDAFPDDGIRLCRPPVVAIAKIEYYDEDGVLQLLDPSNYVLDARTEPGYVLPAVDTDWPATQDRANAVVVQFICGYSDAASFRPDLVNWIRIRAADAIDNRESVDKSGRLAKLPFIDSLLASAATPEGALWGA